MVNSCRLILVVGLVILLGVELFAVPLFDRADSYVAQENALERGRRSAPTALEALVASVDGDGMSVNGGELSLGRSRRRRSSSAFLLQYILAICSRVHEPIDLCSQRVTNGRRPYNVRYRH